MPFVSLIGVLGDADVAGGPSEPLLVAVGVPVTVLRRMMGLADPLDDGFEAGVRSRSVFDHPGGAVGLLEGVSPGDEVTLALFVLRLDVVGVGIVHAVFEGVAGLVLEEDRILIFGVW